MSAGRALGRGPSRQHDPTRRTSGIATTSALTTLIWFIVFTRILPRFLRGHHPSGGTVPKPAEPRTGDREWNYWATGQRLEHVIMRSTYRRESG